MRSLLRNLLVAIGVLALTLAAAPIARAGGPTSVIVVWPAENTAAAFYYSDPEYQQLQDTIGDLTGGKPDDLAQVPAGSGYVNVTWLIHDVVIWRTDRISLGDDRVSNVHTVEFSLSSQTKAVGADHPAARPVELNTLLDRILTERRAQKAATATTTWAPTSAPASTAPATAGGSATAPAAAPTTAGSAAAAAPPPTGGGGGDGGWWWALAGLILGAGGTALLWRGRSLRATVEPPPLLG